MKLSIITINYNNIAGLRRTGESVIAQEVDGLEWIIIDGGSTDGSRKLIEQYAPYVSYWCSEQDGGIYNAMNKGIRVAKGEYLLFLNSGDALFSKETMAKILAKEYVEDFVYGYLIDAETNKKKPCFARHHLTATDFLISSLPHQATLVRRDLFTRYGFYDESYRIVSDWKFFLETIVLRNASIKYIDMPIAIFDNGGVSSQMSNLHKSEREKVLHELFSKRLLEDLYLAVSLKETLKNKFCAHAYSFLYRLATWKRIQIQ